MFNQANTQNILHGASTRNFPQNIGDFCVDIMLPLYSFCIKDVTAHGRALVILHQFIEVERVVVLNDFSGLSHGIELLHMDGAKCYKQLQKCT